MYVGMYVHVHVILFVLYGPFSPSAGKQRSVHIQPHPQQGNLAQSQALGARHAPPPDGGGPRAHIPLVLSTAVSAGLVGARVPLLSDGEF